MSNFDVEEYALKKANEFVGEGITSAQLRKFYNEFKGLERKYQAKLLVSDSRETSFISILPQIKIMKAKVSYSRSRKLVKEGFEKWMKNSVDAINTPKDFEAFLLHFEAVVGYAYGTGKLQN